MADGVRETPATSRDDAPAARRSAPAAAADARDDVLGALRRLYSLFPASAKRNSLILVGMMLVGAVLEVLGVAVVPAFVSAVVEPDRFSHLPVVGGLLTELGELDGGRTVIWAAAALILVFGIKNGFLVFNVFCQARFITNRRIDLGARLTNAYMQAPYPFHLARNTAEMLRNIDREVNVISYQVIAAVLEICTRGLILAAVLLFLFAVEPWITLCWLLIFGSLAAGGVQAASRKLKHGGIEEQAQRKQFVQALYQGFGSVKEARVLNRERFFADKISGSIRRMATVFGFKLFAGKAVSPMTEFLAITGLLVLAVALVMLGRPTESILVTLSMFIVGLVRLKEMISVVMHHLANLRYGIVAIDPVYEDLTVLESGSMATAPRAEPPAPRPLARRIQLDDVWYRYDQADDHALQGIDVEVLAGAAIGFVGSTGSGKSTLIDILLGLLEPQQGGVLVDGVDIRRDGVGSWQTAIGYVPQSIYLLDDTIRRNIALGVRDEDIDEDALWTAVRTAQLESFIARQPQGLESVIGEHGARLSGGERQRIGIARALYNDPQVLVLDEATSSLDNATEKAVIQAVEALKGERTIVMIAHRLTTVQNCDKLYFLKDGRIEAEGNYAELADAHPEFRVMAAG